MKQSESLFVLSSAINTRFGVFESKERFDQTLLTCESIKQKCGTNTKIILIESGTEKLSDSQLAGLGKYDVDVIDYTSHPDVVNISKIESHDIVKNVVETFVFTDFYTRLFESFEASGLSSCKRIFKLSSRYTLNSNFDYDFHMKSKKKIIIKGPYTSQFDPKITNGATKQYMARLYSFDSSLLPYMMCVYQNSLDNMLERINNKGYIDIEHCLFKYIKSNFVNLTDKQIGVEGIIAPIGKEVSE
jgi:hypothetical protein